MKNPFKKIVVWFEHHHVSRWLLETVVAAFVVGVVGSIPSATRPYVLWFIQHVVSGTHWFPVIGWVVVGPLAAIGGISLWRTRHPALDMPDRYGMTLWRGTWNGLKVTDVRPVCPNPNCGLDLTITESEDPDRPGIIIFCNAICGFMTGVRSTEARYLAEVKRNLESQAQQRFRRT
jgi:hypothetical protein